MYLETTADMKVIYQKKTNKPKNKNKENSYSSYEHNAKIPKHVLFTETAISLAPDLCINQPALNQYLITHNR